MKKSLIALLVVLALIVTVSVFSVSADMEHDYTLDANNQAYCPHCDKTVTFTAYSSGNLWSSHYYLTGDLSAKAFLAGSNAKAVIHLNGHTVSNTSRVFNQYNACELYIIGGGGTVQTSGSHDAIYANHSGAKIHLYDVNVVRANKATADTGNGGAVKVNAGGAIYMHEGTTIQNLTTTSATGGAVQVANGTFEMDGGTISNCSSTNGGGIYLAQGTVNIKGGTISGCQSTGTTAFSGSTVGNGGGAIFANGAETTVNISGGTIDGCSAAFGGGAVAASGSAAVNVSGNAIIQNCKSSNRGGSIYLFGAPLTVSGSAQIKNGNAYAASGPMGGNIYAEGNVTVSGGTISGGNTSAAADTPSSATDSACNIYGNGRGGNICIRGAYTLQITGGTISGGVAPDGGNISLEGSKTDHVLTGGTVSGGYAFRGGNLFLGYGNPTVDLNGTKLTGGRAWAKDYNEETGVYANTSGRGGNIFVGASYTGIFTISSGTIEQGFVLGITNPDANDSVGGGNIYTTKAIGITGTALIQKGQATNGAGGNLYVGGTATNETIISGGRIYYGIVTANRYDAQVKGGGIYNAATITMTAGTIEENYAQCEYSLKTGETAAVLACGGNIYNVGTFNMSDGTIKCGIARRKGADSKNLANGGNIYNVGTFEATAGSIEGGSAILNGANVYVADGTFTLGGTIKGDSTKTVEGLYTRNSVDGSGIYIDENGTAILNEGSTIKNCVATGNGGGIYYATGTLTVNGATTLEGNQANKGGNLYLAKATEGDTPFSLTNITLKGGNATNDGGNLYIESTADAVDLPEGVTISGGTAKNGGNVYINNNTMTISGGTVTGKNGDETPTNATTHGGNIYVNAGTLNLNSGLVTYGEAGSFGGNIYLVGTNAENIATLTMDGGTISHGHANYTGGVMLNDYSKMVMTAGTVEENGSNLSGGSIRTNRATSTLEISGTAEIKNGSVTSGQGGNLFSGQNAVIKITGGTFSGGEATTEGGNIYLGGFDASSVFKDFTIRDGEAGNGGNLYVSKGITLGGNVTITGGTAANGGNLYNTATVNLGTDENADGVADGLVTISNGTAKANKDGNGFGGNIYATGYVKIYNRVIENEVVTAGTDIFGGIATYYHAVNDAGDTITIKGGGGGNIYTTANQTIPAGYKLTDGKAINGNGGNIYVAGGTTLLNADAVKDGEGKVTGYENLSTVSGGTALRETVTHTPDGAEKPTATNTGANGMGGNIYVAGGVLDVYANITSNGSAQNPTAQHGGNVYIAGGEMKLHTGTVSGAYALSHGGNIYIAGAGKLTATGGTITSGMCAYNGGNLFVNGTGASTLTDVTMTLGYPHSINIAQGKLTLKDTTVSGVTKDDANGAVILTGGELVLNTGAKISGNACRNVYINGGKVTMNGGEILANAKTSVDNGHNVYIKTGTFDLKGGDIKDGVVTANGGNVYMEAGNFNQSGGAVSGGNAVLGGNVYIAAGTYEMKGGSISGGKVGTTADAHRGGNVYLAGGEFKMSDDGDENAETKPEVKDGTAYNGGNIFALAGKLNIAAGTISNTIQCNRGANVSIFGGTEHVMSGGEIINGKATAFGANLYMQGGSMLMTGGKIKDGSLDGTTAVGSLVGGNIAIRTAAASFTLNCTTEDDGIISGGVAYQAGNVHIDRGTFTLIAGTVKDGTSDTGANINLNSADKTNSTLIMQGGLVSGGNGTTGSIRLGSYGSFNMSGGEVTGGVNASANGGGNIYQNTGTAVTTITGGKITGGKATAGAGGNLWINAGTITLANATVSGGEAATTGGNVFISASATIGNYEGAKGIQNVKFDGGEAGTTGGNVHINKVTTFTDCKFFNGVSGTHGGNLYVNAAGTNITGCHFSGGVAGTEEVNGRGGNLAGYAAVNVSNTTFEDGVAHGVGSLAGGNAYVQAASTFNGCTFNNGVAENGYGGNIACHGNVEHTFTDCVVEDGTALRGGNIHLHRADITVVLDGDTVVDASDAKTASESNRGNNICVNVANAHLKIKGNTIVKNGNGGGNPSIAVTYGGFLTVSGNAQVDKTLMKASYTTSNGVTTAVAAPTGLTLGAQDDPFNGEIAVAWQYHYIDGNAVYTNGVKVIPYEDVENHKINMTKFGNNGSVIVYNSGGTSYPTVYDNGTLTIVGYTGFKAVMVTDEEGNEVNLKDENDNDVYKEVGLANLNGIKDGDYAYIKLYTDLKTTTEITLTSNTPFDLNNRTAHFITGGNYNVNVIDYRSDGGVTTNGKFTADYEEKITKDQTVVNPVNDNQYLSVKVDTDNDGIADTWTANRIKVSLEKVSIRPRLYGNAEENGCGIYYTANILTNSNVAPYLTEYGVAATAAGVEIDENFVENDSILYTAIGISTTGSVNRRVTSGMLKDVMTTPMADDAAITQNKLKGEANVDARAYVTVMIGGNPVKVLSNESKPCTMMDLMKQMDENFGKLNPVKDAVTINSVRQFFDDYYPVMTDWNLTNLEADRAARNAA